jgi:hypothetical protein
MRIALSLGLAWAWFIGPGTASAAVPLPELSAGRPPKITPDYSGIVIPPNIAPLNFVIREPGQSYRVRIFSRRGSPLEIASRKPSITLPLRSWGALLQANGGEEIYCHIATKDSQGHWLDYPAITNFIAPEAADNYLVYRWLKPLYNAYADLGIYQRDLRNYDVTEVLHNRVIDRDCLNCHTFLQNEPDRMVLQIRGRQHGKPMILVRTNTVAQVTQTAGYSSWHPSGRLLAFSANRFSQFFHTIGETREVFDAESDLKIYRVDSNRVVTPPVIALPKWLETWPAWSPDGKFLYFCRTPQLDKAHFREIRYDLLRVPYDIESDVWGQPETLVAARDTGLSAGEPRLSPDGRFLVFCLFDYGNFPVFQPSSDLYLMELATRRYRRLELNSPESDSWHCWSSNSRWLVFSSKRLDGLFARPFFSYVDEQGRCSKPFVLPQSDPAFYDSCLKTFNVPELIRHPIPISERELARAVVAPRLVLEPKVDSSPTATGSPVGKAQNEEDTRYQQVPR